MPRSFSFHVPTQVEFGAGASAKILTSLKESERRVALIRGASGRAAQSVTSLLERNNLLACQVTCPSEPTVSSVNEAISRLINENINVIVACGGGSVIDAGKAVSFCLGHRITLTGNFADVSQNHLNQPSPIRCVAIPTTAGTGAEVTANAVIGIPEKQAKVSLRGRGLCPALALVDPELLRSAPKETVLSAGLDAVVQTIESYSSCVATPFSDAMTEPNIIRGLKALKTVLAKDDKNAWNDLAWVSLTSGLALANSGLGAAHGIASVLGGRYGAPHGALCGRLLIPVLRQNTASCQPGTATARRLALCRTAIADVFQPEPGNDELSGLTSWIDKLGLPKLRHLGIGEREFDDLAKLSASASSSKKNAVSLTVEDYRSILRAAH